MKDEELQRIISELDSALEIFHENRDQETDSADAKIRTQLLELRRDLAVYRAISATPAKDQAP